MCAICNSILVSVASILRLNCRWYMVVGVSSLDTLSKLNILSPPKLFNILRAAQLFLFFDCGGRKILDFSFGVGEISH